MAKKYFRCREYADGHRPVQEVHVEGLKFTHGNVYKAADFDERVIAGLEVCRAAKGNGTVHAIEWLDEKPQAPATAPAVNQKGQ